MKQSRYTATGKLLKIYLQNNKTITLLLVFLPFLFANAAGKKELLLWTPFGWSAYARPFAEENFLLFAFAIPVIALLAVIAYILSDRRDMGGSYIRERSSRAYGRRYFKSPLALAWRLQRGMLFVWIAAYTIMGLVIASLMPNINKILEGTAFLL